MQKTCIITGGSSGIGLATAKRFIQNGFRVFNLDIQPSETGELITCDVSSVQSVEEAVRKVIQATGNVDVLISNAGIHFSATIENTSESDFDRIMAINVKGTYAVIRATLPVMRARKKGVITLVGSEQCLVGKRNSFIYNLSKHAIASMVKTTALDYASEGIRVNGICPGTTETPLYHKAIEKYCLASGQNKEKVHEEEKAMQPMGRLGTAEEVAAFIEFLSGDEAGFITGSLHVMDGGYTCQ